MEDLEDGTESESGMVPSASSPIDRRPGSALLELKHSTSSRGDSNGLLPKVKSRPVTAPSDEEVDGKVPHSFASSPPSLHILTLNIEHTITCRNEITRPPHTTHHTTTHILNRNLCDRN